MGISPASLSVQHMNKCMQWPWRLQRATNPLKLELPTVVNCHVASGNGTSGRVTSALNCQAITPYIYLEVHYLIQTYK